MSITVVIGENYVTASIPLKSSLNELSKWKEFMQRVLKYSLRGRNVILLTLSPQKYSFGYELASSEERKFNKQKILINFIEKVSDILITDLIQSEEFIRGLLKIVVSDKLKSFGDLRFVKGDYTDLKEELMTIEDDGTAFYWYNPDLPKNQIEQKLNELAKSI